MNHTYSGLPNIYQAKQKAWKMWLETSVFLTSRRNLMSVPLLKTSAVPCASSVETGLKKQVQGSSAVMFVIPGRAGQHYPPCVVKIRERDCSIQLRRCFKESWTGIRTEGKPYPAGNLPKVKFQCALGMPFSEISQCRKSQPHHLCIHLFIVTQCDRTGRFVKFN